MDKEKNITTNYEIEEINRNYLLNIFDYEALDKKKLIANLEIGSEGFIIKNLRLKKELTQKELAKELNISENTIYNYENGKTKPTKNNWIKVTSFLEINSNFNKTISLMMFVKSHDLRENYNKISLKENEIDKIAKKINTFGDDVFRKIIIPHCIAKRQMNISEIDNLLNAYYIINHNLKYVLELNKFQIEEGKEEELYFILREIDSSGFGLKLDEFINEFLIPLSNAFDFIFKNIDSVRNIALEGEDESYEHEYKFLLNKLLSYEKEGGSIE